MVERVNSKLRINIFITLTILLSITSVLLLCVVRTLNGIINGTVINDHLRVFPYSPLLVIICTVLSPQLLAIPNNQIDSTISLAPG